MKKINRVLVLGCGGSGKSTFSVRLEGAAGLKLYHLDSFYWKPGWNHTPEKKWIRVVKGLIRRNKWIIDGSYDGTLDLRLKRAEAVVFFDLPRWVCLWRILKRRVQNMLGTHRLGMPEGCPERVYGTFVKWVWNYRETNRPRVIEKLNQFSKRGKVYFVTNSKQADALIEELRG